MRLLRSIIFPCLILAILAAAVPAAGQDTEVTRKTVISTNPITDMFTWYNGELEIRVATTSTVGISGTYVSLDDDSDTYVSTQGFYRYYPQGKALEGFFFGGRLGYYRVEVKSNINDEEESGDFFGLGIDIGYSWLLGAEKRFYVGLGIGAVRLFGGDLEDVTLTLPTIRLINVGVAF